MTSLTCAHCFSFKDKLTKWHTGFLSTIYTKVSDVNTSRYATFRHFGQPRSRRHFEMLKGTRVPLNPANNYNNNNARA